MNLTVKNDENVKKLASILGKQPAKVKECIAKGLEDRGFLNEVDYGLPLKVVIEFHEGLILSNIIFLIFGSYSPSMDKPFSELIVWGAADDCENCGCETEIFDQTGQLEVGENGLEAKVQETIYKCTNCGHKTLSYGENS